MVIASHMDTVAHASLTCKVLSAALERCGISGRDLKGVVTGNGARYIEMAGTGHNALDFHIAYYIGHIAAVDKDAYFHIVSNDTGFDPLIAHLKQEHIFADRVAKVADMTQVWKAE